MAGFHDRVLWNLSPPRIRYDYALLDLAAEGGTDLQALGTLADACGSRRTTARRLLETLGERDRISRRGWLASVLLDIDLGTCSVLEHGYLVHVERAHGPTTSPWPIGTETSTVTWTPPWTACSRSGSATARCSSEPA